nr:PIN domain-containing protein [Bacteroidales bacterium]
MKKHSKIFVVDTNVILHDYNCIYNFEENHVIIPIVVLEELDKLKKGNEEINFNAREFTRELDRISGDKLFNGGISLGKDKGKLSIETGKIFSDKLKKSFAEFTPDHRILAITEDIKKNNKSEDVILITKDINLRMKAKSLGILAQDYKTDKIADIELLHKNIEVIDNLNNELISKLYES